MKRITGPEAQRLLEAIARDEVITIEALIKQGVSVDQELESPDRYAPVTLLEYACETGARKVAEFLIRAEAKLDKGRYKPLSLAALAGQTEIVRLLLEGGANPNAKTSDPSEGQRGLTALIYAVSDPAKRDISELLLQHGADPHAVTNKESSALTCAIESGNVFAIEKLLAMGCRAVGPVILGPVHEGDLETVRQLIRVGADVNVVGTKDTCLEHRTPLEGAVEHRGSNFLFLKALKNGGKLERDDIESKALANDAYLQIARELLQAGAQPDRITYIEAPLYKAGRVGDLEIAELLLEAGADVKAAISIWPPIKGAYRDTALHVATKEAVAPMVEFLIAAGAEVNRPDCNGHTPLDYAERQPSAEISNLLRNVGAKKGKTVLEMPAEWELNI